MQMNDAITSIVMQCYDDFQVDRFITGAWEAKRPRVI